MCHRALVLSAPPLTVLLNKGVLSKKSVTKVLSGRKFFLDPSSTLYIPEVLTVMKHVPFSRLQGGSWYLDRCWGRRLGFETATYVAFFYLIHKTHADEVSLVGHLSRMLHVAERREKG